MKPLLILILLSLALSCTDKPVTQFATLLNPGNLKEQAFDIDVTKDTVIVTGGGTKISIPANAIAADGNTVMLLVKEAYTIKDIVRAGLYTHSSKGLLSSAGMINISTKQQSVIKSGIGVSIPAKFAIDEMKIYKGNEEDDKIDWVDPQPLQKVKTDLSLLGEAIFKNNCASCHAVEKDLAGPALANVEKRRPMEWLRAFTRDNQKLIRSGDDYACCIYQKWNKTAMNLFPMLTDDELDAVYNYIEKVTDSLGIPNDYTTSCDTCADNENYKTALLEKRNQLVEENGTMTNIQVLPDSVTVKLQNRDDSDDIFFDNSRKVASPVYQAEYYQFTIIAYGWYNVDAMLGNLPNVEESVLKVKLEGFSEKVNVCLIIPSTKTFAEGGFLKGSNEFGFYDEDGKIPLPQNTVAYVMALGEKDGKLFFAKQMFTTSKKQVIRLDVRETKQDTIMQAVVSLQLNKVAVAIEKTKNFETLKEIDAELKKAANGCGCNERMPADTITHL